MVVEAGEVLQPFRASKKRPTPTATLPRRVGLHRARNLSVAESPATTRPPSPAWQVWMVIPGWRLTVC